MYSPRPSDRDPSAIIPTDILKKGTEAALAAGIGVGLATVLFPGASPIAAAIVGVAKYTFDHTSDPLTFKQNLKQRILPIYSLCIGGAYISGKFLMTAVSIKSIASLYILAFPFLISKKLVSNLRKSIIQVFTTKKAPISIALKAILGTGIFYAFALNPLHGLAYGAILHFYSQLGPMIFNHSLKHSDGDSQSTMNKKGALVSLVILGLSYKISQVVGPILFGATGLAACGALNIANFVLLQSSIFIQEHITPSERFRYT